MNLMLKVKPLNSIITIAVTVNTKGDILNEKNTQYYTDTGPCPPIMGMHIN
jgi:hypothetical protein